VTRVISSSMYEITLLTGEVFEIRRGLLTVRPHLDEPASKRPRNSNGSSGGGSGGSNSGGADGDVLLPTITSSITINSHDARQEATAIIALLPRSAATTQFLARIQSPATNTLELFAALHGEVLDSGILSTAPQQAQRVGLLRAALAQQQQPVEPPAVDNDLPLVNIDLSVSTGAARQELSDMLSHVVYTAAVGTFMMRLWNPLTNTLQLLLAVMADVIAADMLTQQQAARVSLYHTLLSNAAPAQQQQQQQQQE
jgi:hypothetical protein